MTKNIFLNKEFEYKIIKFNCVPRKSQPSTPNSAFEKCKNSSNVREHNPKPRSTVQITTKVQNEQVINKTIIGLKRSKKKSKTPKTKHAKSNSNQSSASEQQSSPTTSSTSQSRKRHRSLKEHFF